MRLLLLKGKPAITAGLFSLLVLITGLAHGVTPVALESGQQEVILKVENMT